MRASPRLRRVWLAWCAALAMALASGTSLNIWLRGTLLLVLLGLCRQGWLLLGSHPGQPQRIAWASDGRWQVQDALHGLRYVWLTRRPQQFGPLIWLPLAGENAYFPVLIDGRYAEPVALAALKAALTLDRPTQADPETNG